MKHQSTNVGNDVYPEPSECRLGTLSEREQISIGLTLMRGQSWSRIARDFGCSLHDIENAWETCKARLSRHFAVIEGKGGYLMHDRELELRRDACVEHLEACVARIEEQDRAPLDG